MRLRLVVLAAAGPSVAWAYQLRAPLPLRRSFILRSAVPCASDVMLSDGGERSGWDDEMRRKYMEEVTLGTEGGGWDNDEYLESIHNEGPGTSNEELLYQAIAYTKMLAENRMKPKPEYKKIIDDLRSQMSEDEQRHVEERFAAEAAGREAALAAKKNKLVTAAKPPPPPAPRPPAPPATTQTLTNANGVTSGSSYASILNAGAVAPRAPPVAPAALPAPCLLYTSPSPRDRQKSRMPSSA